MAKDLGVATPTVFAAFSVALLVVGGARPDGRPRDRPLGRPAGADGHQPRLRARASPRSALARGPSGLFAAWVIHRRGMGSGLYEAAFAALVRLYGTDSRGAITGITLIAGFASTVGWPLSAWLESAGRLARRVLRLGRAASRRRLPLNAILPRAGRQRGRVAAGRRQRLPAAPPPADAAPRRRAAGDGVRGRPGSSARRWPRTCRELLQASGATLAAAVGVGALIGPAQVAGRLLEFGFLRRLHPLLSARLAALMHPARRRPAAALRRAGRSRVRGVARRRQRHPDDRQRHLAAGALRRRRATASGRALLMVPARVAQALAPWLFGLCLDRWGVARDLGLGRGRPDRVRVAGLAARAAGGVEPRARRGLDGREQRPRLKNRWRWRWRETGATGAARRAR